jgi:Na+/H+-dicarboxylate symporter
VLNARLAFATNLRDVAQAVSEPFLQLQPLRALSGRLERLVEGRLWLKVLLALFAGTGFGMLLGPDLGLLSTEMSHTIAQWVALPGLLFLALIQMIVIPLVFASIIRGLTASESIEKLRQIGLRAVAFFAMTTALATVIGISLALAIRPGRYIETVEATGPVARPEAPGGLPSLSELPQQVIGMLPTNPLESMVTGQMLQVILFAVVLGVALLSMAPARSAPLYDVLGSLQDACMTVVRGAMRLAPLAVFGLMARLTATVGLSTLAGMAVYVATVLLGLAILMLAYLLIVALAGGRRPLDFLARTREVLLLAFSTSSSAAVMPLSMRTAEDDLGIQPATARFVIPLGATINMTGTALYQGVATVFLAQIFGIDLAPGSLALVVVMAVAASIGSPATPGVGMVILAMVLESVGIPASGVVLLMGVDRLLDMSRTSVNVMGDLVACTVLDRLAGHRPERDLRPDLGAPT